MYERLRRIWSRTHLISGLPVPHFLSSWTNNPHKIDPPGQTVPIKFGPHGQMVPKNLVPLDKWSPRIWSPWTNGPQEFGPPGQMVPNQFGSHLSGSPQPVPLDERNILGTICPGGPNWLGTIRFVHGDRIDWGPYVQRDQSIGDHLNSRPEEPQ